VLVDVRSGMSPHATPLTPTVSSIAPAGADRASAAGLGSTASRDWLEALEQVLRSVARDVSDDIVGLGIDFTSCTVLPTT